MAANTDRRNRLTLFRDLFAAMPLDRQAMELEILQEIHRLAVRGTMREKQPQPEPALLMPRNGSDG